MTENHLKLVSATKHRPGSLKNAKQDTGKQLITETSEQAKIFKNVPEESNNK